MPRPYFVARSVLHFSVRSDSVSTGSIGMMGIDSADE